MPVTVKRYFLETAVAQQYREHVAGIHWKEVDEYHDWLTIGWGAFEQKLHDNNGQRIGAVWTMEGPTSEYKENAKR